ncbi:MAG: right-handed parallel beta-helix repeat-containing protein, partial [Spirochaetes bacterium]|nr:right-handed parallel beta-helix repeat-containing protein [Spirochaetota bacterium]
FMKKKTILLFLMLIILMSCFNDLNDLIYEFSEFREPICVIIGGTANGSGRGWAQAYSSLQTAIDDASPGDEIWVAGDMTVSSPMDVINISEAVSIYGGFKGNESKREEAKGRSLVSGSVAGSLITVSVTDASIAGFEFTNTGGRAIRIGSNCKFTVNNCNFIGNSSSDGGAVYCDSFSELCFTDCIFLKNFSSGFGGSVWATTQSCLNFINCSFIENSSVSGGAIFSIGMVKISNNCLFESNFTDSLGGAIYIGINGLILNISGDCVFKNNHSRNFGGALSLDGGRLNIESNCIFENNYAETERGGVINLNSVLEATISNCSFDNNHSDDSGGGIYAFGSTACQLSIRNCRFEGNFSNSGGAISLFEFINVSVNDCVFLYNSALGSSGGAIYKKSTVSFELTDCYFQGNTPDDVY